ncbi:MAG: hypothetical protein H7A53_00465 [Akkermansiaceae bacterium]|nr:hypothetical protein [Akkermansiaceae bacterium]
MFAAARRKESHETSGGGKDGLLAKLGRPKSGHAGPGEMPEPGGSASVSAKPEIDAPRAEPLPEPIAEVRPAAAVDEISTEKLPEVVNPPRSDGEPVIYQSWDEVPGRKKISAAEPSAKSGSQPMAAAN